MNHRTYSEFTAEIEKATTVDELKSLHAKWKSTLDILNGEEESLRSEIKELDNQLTELNEKLYKVKEHKLGDINHVNSFKDIEWVIETAIGQLVLGKDNE